MFYNFASRTQGSSPYLAVDQDRDRLRAKAVDDPPPVVVKPYVGLPRVSLPDASDAWRAIDRPLPQVLRDRRTVRHFAADAVSRKALNALLATTVGLAPHSGGENPLPDGSTFKPVASGGARHPIELYVLARHIEGLARATYYYDFVDHTLVRTSDVIDDAQLAALAGDQPWVTSAPLLMIYTGRVGKSMWKYQTSRAYRVLHCDLGHVSQNVYLCVEALGLACAFTAALRDEILEDHLGLDGVTEIPLALTAVGHRGRHRSGLRTET